MSHGTTPTFRRSTDLILLSLSALALLLATLIYLTSKGYIHLADRILPVVKSLPPSIASEWQRIAPVGALGAALVLVLIAAGTGRWLLARNLAVSTALAGLVLMGAGLLLPLPVSAVRIAPELTIIAAIAALLDGFMSNGARRLAWSITLFIAVAEYLLGIGSLIEIIGGLALGVLLAALTNLLLGVPREDLSALVIKQAFAPHDIVIRQVTPVCADARSSVPYFAQAEDGTEYFIKLIGTEQRNADFLFKLWRSVLFKWLVSPAPFLTSMQQIEHEAYVMLLAQKHGVRTPDLEFTAPYGSDFALLAQRRVPGRELGALQAQDVTDALLIEIWKQVANLHAARICHNDLRLANILADKAKQAWIIDFGFAVADADDNALNHDTAQLLASMSYVVGAERAVVTAHSVIGKQGLAGTMPYLIPLGLSTETLAQLREKPDLIEEIKKVIGEISPVALTKTGFFPAKFREQP